MATNLTVTAIRNSKGGPARREIHDGGGLYLVVQPSGSMSWALRYRRDDGSNAKLTLGPLRLLEPGEPEPQEPLTIGHPLTLTQARALAATESLKVAQDRDPAKERAAAVRQRKEDIDARAASVFEVVAVRFIERYLRKANRESSWREAARLLGFKPDDADPKKLVQRKAEPGVFAGVAAHWKGRPVQEISKADVSRLLRTIVDGGAAYSANRVLAVLRRLFNWLIEQDELTTSPCAGVKPPTVEVKRDHVLSDCELALVWRGAEALGEPFGPFIRLLLLTGQRRDEVAEMRWNEVDLEAAMWTLPRERVKNDRGHQVPLSDQAVAILTGVTRIAGKPDFVFTSRSRLDQPRKPSERALAPISGFSKTKARLDAEMVRLARQDATDAGLDPDEIDLPGDWRLHDLRRTCATGLARLKQPVHVTEAVLNHRSGSISGVAAIYNRYDYAEEKRTALAAWGSFVDRLVSEDGDSNVVSIAQAVAS